MASAVDLLQQGIAAVKAGQKDTARRLLTGAVEQDERNITAWLWLSGVVESLEDKQVCLENVLALDPNNPSARKGLDWVLGQKKESVYTPPLISESQAQPSAMPLSPAAAMLYGREKVEAKVEVEAEAAPPPYMTPVTQVEWDAMREFDSETLCPYCAAPTQPDDKACSQCHGKLWRSHRKREQPSALFWGLIAYLLLNTLATVCGAFAVFWILTQAPSQLTAQLKTQVSTIALIPLGAIVVIQVAQFVLVYMRWQPMYWVLIALAVVNLVAGLALMFISMNIATVVGFAFSFVPLVFLFLIEEDFMMVHERIWCGPDKGIRSHSEFYARGREYARNKMWTLAALHFRRAVAGAPNLVAYHLALTAAYVGLKRTDRAESVLREAKRLEPGNPRVQELADLIASSRQTSVVSA